MKTITIGRVGCDIVIPDGSVSRNHATISMVNGQYVFCDTSRNGSTINGRVLCNERMVVSPGTPIYLANKVPLPWPQVLMLLPSTPLRAGGMPQSAAPQVAPAREERLGPGWCLLILLIPLPFVGAGVGFFLSYYWKDIKPGVAKQAFWLALISGGIWAAILS